MTDLTWRLTAALILWAIEMIYNGYQIFFITTTPNKYPYDVKPKKSSPGYSYRTSGSKNLVERSRYGPLREGRTILEQARPLGTSELSYHLTA
jgi:hypothetical protein